MCGLVGWWDRAASPGETREWLARSLGLLRHRGPDAEGVWMDGPSGFALGHRRLSILDLSAAGTQPMASEDGTLRIVHNGEIYNYREIRRRLEGRARFRTATDTEVILRLYEEKGVDCTADLEGMFAFAICDAARGRLLLVRDRPGIKPLFYCQDGGRFAFASEVKALLALPWVSRELDPIAVAQYVTYGYVPAPRTVFASIRKLPPAHRLLLDNGGITLEPYWTLRIEPDARARSETEWADALDEALGRAVAGQLVSDVPLGALLSGGLDSSLIVALMSGSAGGRIRTFSIGFRGMGYYDERRYARAVAQRFGTDHHEFEVEPRAAEDLSRILWHFDEPFADSSAIALYYLSRLTRSHVTVALSGTGGDDLFGGYRRYASHPLARMVGSLPAWASRWGSALAERLPGSRQSRWGESVLLLRRLAAVGHLSPDESYCRLMALGDPSSLTDLLQHPVSLDDVGVLGRFLARSSSPDPVSRRLFADFHTYLPDDLLAKEDRMTMAFGLEGRVPLLDETLIELAARLPVALKVRGLTTKYLLKKVAERYLPAGIVHRRKHGFAVPVSEWLRGPLRGLGEEVLLAGGSGWFRRPAVAELWRAHQQGADRSALLYALLVFEMWHRDRGASGGG
ncbi:MAG: asparagine synthase (glutamine-hydrolyzing) [Candidatus Rokubacteria bacterium]|nr:asparagine synthase (glutamine-hydrolyzing) [Candidatus Rokubacteria bacterium]